MGKNDSLSISDRNKLIFVTGKITDVSMIETIGRLLYLDSLDIPGDITMYIDSPGGFVSAGLAIIDIMLHIETSINTVALGTCASMAAMILVCGDSRKALPHSEILFHVAHAGFQGDYVTVGEQMEQFTKAQKYLERIVKKTTDFPIETFKNGKDHCLTAKEALSYSVIDEIIEHTKGTLKGNKRKKRSLDGPKTSGKKVTKAGSSPKKVPKSKKSTK